MFAVDKHALSCRRRRAFLARFSILAGKAAYISTCTGLLDRRRVRNSSSRLNQVYRVLSKFNFYQTLNAVPTLEFLAARYFPSGREEKRGEFAFILYNLKID